MIKSAAFFIYDSRLVLSGAVLSKLEIRNAKARDWNRGPSKRKK